MPRQIPSCALVALCIAIGGCSTAPITVGRSDAGAGPVSESNSCFELRYEGPSTLVSHSSNPDGVHQNLEVHVVDSVTAAFREIVQTWPIRCSERDLMKVEIASIQHDFRAAEGDVAVVETCVEVQSERGSEAECAQTTGAPVEDRADEDRRGIADAYEREFRRSLRTATEAAVRRLMRVPGPDQQ